MLNDLDRLKMTTTNMPDNGVTAVIPKQEQVEVQLHENTSIEATTQGNEEILPASGLGIGSGNTANTEQPQLEVVAEPIPEQHQLIHTGVEQTVVADTTNHVPTPEVPNRVDTSAMIAEAGKRTKRHDMLLTDGIQFVSTASPRLSKI